MITFFVCASYKVVQIFKRSVYDYGYFIRKSDATYESGNYAALFVDRSRRVYLPAEKITELGLIDLSIPSYEDYYIFIGIVIRIHYRFCRLFGLFTEECAYLFDRL